MEMDNRMRIEKNGYAAEVGKDATSGLLTGTIQGLPEGVIIRVQGINHDDVADDIEKMIALHNSDTEFPLPKIRGLEEFES